jgi:hypothetical protein
MPPDTHNDIIYSKGLHKIARLGTRWSSRLFSSLFFSLVPYLVLYSWLTQCVCNKYSTSTAVLSCQHKNSLKTQLSSFFTALIASMAICLNCQYKMKPNKFPSILPHCLTLYPFSLFALGQRHLPGCHHMAKSIPCCCAFSAGRPHPYFPFIIIVAASLSLISYRLRSVPSKYDVMYINSPSCSLWGHSFPKSQSRFLSPLFVIFVCAFFLKSSISSSSSRAQLGSSGTAFHLACVDSSFFSQTPSSQDNCLTLVAHKSLQYINALWLLWAHHPTWFNPFSSEKTYFVKRS